jgi:hypothetical protein
VLAYARAPGGHRAGGHRAGTGRAPGGRHDRTSDLASAFRALEAWREARQYESESRDALSLPMSIRELTAAGVLNG